MLMMTNQNVEMLERVNLEVNKNVWPVSDIEKWKRVEYWSDAELEGDEGDCEDYCISKRRRLLELGVDRDDMNLAVVKDNNGEGHAVLIVTTSRGQLALDNLRDEILPWDETGYDFVMMETADKDKSRRIWRKVED